MRTEIIKCKKCGYKVSIYAKKHRNKKSKLKGAFSFTSLVGRTFEPHDVKHDCKGVKDEWLLYENRFKNPTIN